MQELKYEDAVKKLTEIMEKLESGETPLDKTFEMYEKGTELIKFCKKKLTEAEGRILKISKSKNEKETGL
ncbi:MAG: exodeoxyribonuclease VII small subunit [Candidatus Delongbacteria bacterium]